MAKKKNTWVKFDKIIFFRKVLSLLSNLEFGVVFCIPAFLCIIIGILARLVGDPHYIFLMWCMGGLTLVVLGLLNRRCF